MLKVLDSIYNRAFSMGDMSKDQVTAFACSDDLNAYPIQPKHYACHIRMTFALDSARYSLVGSISPRDKGGICDQRGSVLYANTNNTPLFPLPTLLDLNRTINKNDQGRDPEKAQGK